MRAPRGTPAVAVMLAAVLCAGVAAAYARAVVWGAAAAPARDAPPVLYLALGDSVPVWNGPSSYPYLVLRHLQRRLPGLRLDNLAISGETTGSMLRGGQYARARAVLRAHRGGVALITIDIGGNDVVGCVSASGIDERCAAQARATIRRNLTQMLRGLRALAPRVPLIGMTYYDPFLGDWLAGGALRALAAASEPGLVALNRELTAAYGGRGRTADVQGRFAATDLTTMAPSPWGTVPIAVKRACLWLDLGCRTGSPEIFGDDPNPDGARQIAAAFERTIGPLSPPRARARSGTAAARRGRP